MMMLVVLMSWASVGCPVGVEMLMTYKHQCRCSLQECSKCFKDTDVNGVVTHSCIFLMLKATHEVEIKIMLLKVSFCCESRLKDVIGESLWFCKIYSLCSGPL